MLHTHTMPFWTIQKGDINIDTVSQGDPECGGSCGSTIVPSSFDDGASRGLEAVGRAASPDWIPSLTHGRRWRRKRHECPPRSPSGAAEEALHLPSMPDLPVADPIGVVAQNLDHTERAFPRTPSLWHEGGRNLDEDLVAHSEGPAS